MIYYPIPLACFSFKKKCIVEKETAIERKNNIYIYIYEFFFLQINDENTKRIPLAVIAAV